MRTFLDTLETLGMSVMTCKKHGVKFYDVCGCHVCLKEMEDEFERTCSECSGEGNTEKSHICAKCHGTGEVEETPMTNLWRELSPEEENEFRQWARENYKPGDKVDELWHPVVREECGKINQEAEGTNQ